MLLFVSPSHLSADTTAPDCRLSDSLKNLAEMLQETDFGHPSYTLDSTATSTSKLTASGGAGFWFYFSAPDASPLRIEVTPLSNDSCRGRTRSWCVNLASEAVPDDENLIAPLFDNVVSFLNRKDHGDYPLPDPRCGLIHLAPPDGEQQPETSSIDVQQGHWFALLGWLLLTLLVSLGLAWRSPPPRLRPDGPLARWLLLALFALPLWALAAFLWDSVGFSLLWLFLWPLAIAPLWSLKEHRGLALVLTIIAGVAVVLRIQAPHLPANWYVALEAPDALPVADVVGSGGFAGFFRALGALLPVSSAWVFGWNILASSATVVLFSLSAMRSFHSDGTPRWPAWTGLLWAVLLALDPLQIRLGASDATHITALFALSVAALCYVEALRSRAVLWWMGALLAAAMVGWTRAEYAPAPLVLPLLFGTGSNEQRGRFLQVAGFLGLVAVLVGASLPLRTLHAEATRMGTFQWSTEHITSWFGVLTTQFLREHHLNQALYLLFVPYALWVLVSKRPSRFGPVLAFYLLVAPRVVSAFHEPSVAWNLILARYDLPILAVMALWAAAGINAVWLSANRLMGWLNKKSIPSPRVVAGVTLFTVLGTLILFDRNAPMDDISNDRYPFQVEYEFLQARLDEVERGRVVAVWQQGNRNETHDFDSALALPHPLLVMDYPEVQWEVVNEFHEMKDRAADAFVFSGSNAQLDVQALQKMGYPDDAESVKALRSIERDVLHDRGVLLRRDIFYPAVLRFPLPDGMLKLTWWFREGTLRSTNTEP